MVYWSVNPCLLTTVFNIHTDACGPLRYSLPVAIKALAIQHHSIFRLVLLRKSTRLYHLSPVTYLILDHRKIDLADSRV